MVLTGTTPSFHQEHLLHRRQSLVTTLLLLVAVVEEELSVAVVVLEVCVRLLLQLAVVVL
jgi:hypothetical protein